MALLTRDTLAEDTEVWTARLTEHGYCIIPNVMPAFTVAALEKDLTKAFAETLPSVGPFYGDTTKRFHGLLRRSRHISRFAQHPLITGIAQSILGPHCDTIQINLTQAIEIAPGGDTQPPHRDQDMWPVRVSGIEYLINVMWPFTPYRTENGATVLWPESHRRQDAIVLDPAEAIAAEMDPGSVLLFLGSTLHAGGANRTSLARRGMIISYSLGWLKPYELPWLAYPPEVARSFSASLAALAGYRVHRPNLGTFEGRCPSTMLQDLPCQGGAIDALRPEQEELIAAWRAGLIMPGRDHVSGEMHEELVS